MLTNVRDVASSFVGREEDILAVARRLEEGRLVTILGPGGMGKTRLAIRFAEQRVASFSSHRGGGVWFCDLSEARTAADIVATVASAVNVNLEGPSSDLGLALARRGRILVVLDNFDRLTAHAAVTLGTWLREAPSARFLVTSRTALDLVGEQTWSLSPLPRDEAIELFSSRAKDAQARFTAASRDVVAQIVDAIDRMPLAIELAATRMAVLTPSQLLARLERPLDVLGGIRETSRHASMRRTVLDSVELLEPDLRRLFAACAVMHNGFTFDAAESIMGDVVWPRAGMLDAIATLARSSLLRVEVEEDVARYALFEVIREVASQNLEADEAHAELRARHATFYAAWCGAHGGDSRLVAHEIENLLGALRTAASLALEGPSPARAREAVALALAVDPVLSARGRSRLLLELYDAALAALDAAREEADLSRAQVLVARGRVRREMGETVLAAADFERGLSLARRLPSPALAATALTRLGETRDVAGETAVAQAHFAEALAMLERAPAGRPRRVGEAEAYLRLGHARRREGDLAGAREAVGSATDRYRALSDDEGLAHAMYELAIVEMFAGAHETSFRHFDEGLLVARRADARVAVAALLTARGCLLQDVGKLDGALEHHAEAAGIFHDAGSRYREASALYYLASGYLERGDARETLRILSLARERLAGVGAQRYEVLIAGCTAAALAALGRTREADAALETAERAADILGSEPALACNVRVHRLALELRKRDGEGAARAIAEAEALVAKSPSDDSRFALRTLRGVVDTGAPREEAALVVWSDGGAFQLPHAPRAVPLPDQSPLRHILRTFAERRLAAPGEAVSMEEVIRAGWPGERMDADAALNRAHVALSSLRKLGLRGILVHGGGGYMLSHAVLVRVIKAD
ncbi:MAG TPA: NACHT domain-containing protein [Polyangiaceae bacterium]